MWKSWLPSFRLATELALSIGSKKPQIHMQKQYLGLRFEVGEIGHAF
jgi:hypothetical protein